MKEACNRFFVVLVALALTGCACAPAQTTASGPVSNQVVYASTPATVLPCQTYNNTRPGGNQLWSGVDSMEIRPNLIRNGAQLWFHEDGRWDGQGGKFSLLFHSRERLEDYCRNPNPSPMELRQMTAMENLCPSSVGKGQKWLPFDSGGFR